MNLDTLLDASEALLGEAEALAPEGGAASALALALGRACCASGADLEAMVQVARASLDSSRRTAPRRFAA